MNKLYTMGYSHWSIDQLAIELERLGALLVDIRLNPYSSRSEWRKETLRQRLGKGYIWAGALGNRNYRGGPIELAAPEKAIEPMRRHLSERPCVLMCACSDWQQCHRRQAATFLARTLGVTVEHLEPPLPTGPVGTIPALTLKAPWGWAIFNAGKDIENRSHRRFARLRGRTAIHHSQRVSKAEYLEACEFIRRVSGLEAPHYDDAAHGCVIGTVEVTNFVQYSPSPWYMGAYGLVLRNPKPFEVPVPAKGEQRIWFWAPQEEEVMI
jgi:hypothetical protein